MMTIAGTMLIGSSDVMGTQGTIRAFNPTTAVEIEPDFGIGSEAVVDSACLLAGQAFDSFRETSLADRARFLRMIGQAILDR